MDVDRSRLKGPVRDAPRSGNTSFTQEEVASRRETNGTSEWLQAAHALNDHVQSLELVVLHREEIVEVLLSHAHAESVHALPALLGVLAAVSKDVQQDFVPLLPRVFEHLGQLASKLTSDAAALEAVFSCTSSLLKHTHKFLASKGAWVFKHSRKLRYHPAQHVRCFAAQVCPASSSSIVLLHMASHW